MMTDSNEQQVLPGTQSEPGDDQQGLIPLPAAAEGHEVDNTMGGDGIEGPQGEMASSRSFEGLHGRKQANLLHWLK